MQAGTKRPSLVWEFHPGTYWCAYAPSLPTRAEHPGDPTHYMIGVDENGAFCVTVNDGIKSAGCLSTLIEAKAWCEAQLKTNSKAVRDEDRG